MTEPASAPSDLAVRRYAAAAGAVVVELTGAVDVSTEAAMLAALLETGAGVRLVVCDLRPLSFMGACGLRVLVTARNALLDRGTELRVVATRPVVVRMLGLTRLSEQIGVHADVGEALGSSTSGEKPQ